MLTDANGEDCVFALHGLGRRLNYFVGIAAGGDYDIVVIGRL